MKKKDTSIIGWIFVGVLIVVVVVIVLLAKPWAGDLGTKTDEKSKIEESASENSKPNESSDFIAPFLEWWELYNPNGFDTITAVVRNDNDVAVDISYDLVYYKDGKEVARSEDFANFSILPKHSDLIWANSDIPNASEVDDIVMTNVVVTEAYYGAVDGKYEYIDTIDGEARFRFEFEKKPTLATIWFVLYNDNNGNKKRDKGEIVVVSSDSIVEQVGEASFRTDVYDYTDYEVYFSAQ